MVKTDIKRKILAVDDNPVNLQLLEAIIKRIPDLVVVTENNEKCAVARVLEEKPDLILLDVMMPEIDGFEICSQLKSNEQTAAIPIMFLTANESDRSTASGV